MTDLNAAPAIPDVLTPLVAKGFEFVWEGEHSIWGGARPWRVTCPKCGKVFHPLHTDSALANILAHRCTS